MKLTILTTNLEATSGWGTYARNLAEEAVRNGYEVSAIVHTKTTSEIKGVTQYALLPLPHRVSWNPVHIFMTAWSVRVFLERISPDVVHIVVEPYLQLWLYLSVRYRLIVTFHGTYARLPLTVPGGVRRLFSKKIFTHVLGKVTQAIAVSNRTKEIFLASQNILAEEKVHVIHNSVRLKKDFQSEPRNKRNDLKIITIGMVKRRKGIHHAITYFSAWAEAHALSATYDVVGVMDTSSEYVNEIRALAAKKSSPYFKVIFHGSLTDSEKENLLRASDAYVHLEEVIDPDGDVEGFGIGIIEAAGYGVPALVLRGSATAEAVQDGVSGYVVDLNAPGQIDEAITNLLSKRSIREERVRAWAEAHDPAVLFNSISAGYS